MASKLGRIEAPKLRNKSFDCSSIQTAMFGGTRRHTLQTSIHQARCGLLPMIREMESGLLGFTAGMLVDERNKKHGTMV